MAAISELSISNAALVKVGQPPIESLDEGSKSANLCRLLFAGLRDEVLEDHPWNFAIKRARLAPLAGAPAFGFSFAFQKPADCLRIWAPEPEDVRFAVEDGKVLTDEPTFSCRYIARVENPERFSRGFADALANRLGAEVAYAIAQSTTLQANLMQAYQMSLRAAKSRDAQEGTPEELLQGTWVRSRY